MDFDTRFWMCIDLARAKNKKVKGPNIQLEGWDFFLQHLVEIELNE